MPVIEDNFLQATSSTSEVPPDSEEGRDDAMAARANRQGLLALTFTAAIVAFVGAVIVLTIPYAILSIPLPPYVNPLGLSFVTTQSLLFGRGWYLLVPSTLFALWIGYKFYQWGRRISLTTPDEM